MSYYQSTLSGIHHRDFGQYALHAARFFLDHCLDEPSPRHVVDLGCGSGITARVLCEAGHRVTGMDYSADMLNIARENAPQAHFVQASVFDTAIPGADAVLSIGEVFNYLFDEKSEREALREVFERIYHALAPGGTFLFDLLLNGVMDGKNPQQRIVENERWSMFLYVEEDPGTQTLRREITMFIPEGDLYRRSQEVHRQRLFDEAEVVAMLERLGFEVQTLSAYGELAFRQGHRGFCCRKPGRDGRGMH